MKPYLPRLEVDGHRLDAVPAVHFRVAFAEAINRLCHHDDPAERPKAIAVELGSQTAAAAAEWIRELCVGPQARHAELPCMLGIAKPNRRVRASARERAFALQRATGKPLHELPPRMLKDILGYSALSVLYLSPTDSIIEAIRCAVELDLPLYGVDLEECAEAQRPETLIEDPSHLTRADERLDRYVSRNAGYAAQQRDEEIDGRREMAMAARLKSVLRQHGRVLFTGGLAHWRSLEKLLLDPAVRPAPVPEAASVGERDMQRAVVHPLLAIYHMDVFPAFAQSFELTRHAPHKPYARNIPRSVNVSEDFELMLKAAYKKHFLPEETGEQLDRQTEDLEARPDFEQLLANLCLLNQSRVPNLFTALLAAKGTMSPRFSECLAEVLMEFPWVKPNSFPELPVLAPAPTEPGDGLRAELVEPSRNGGWKPGEWVYVHSDIGRSGQSLRVKIPWRWESQPPPAATGNDNMNLNWPPVDYLLTAMSLRAMHVAVNQRDKIRIEPFDGGLHDGVDIKTTLRAHARGDEKVFVRDVRYRRKSANKSTDEWDPVIWILRTQPDRRSEWDFMGELVSEFLELANLDATPEVKEPGMVMIEQVGFGYRVRPLSKLDPHHAVPQDVRACGHIDHCMVYQGFLLYTPSHFTVREHAIWAQKTRCKRNPFVRYSNPYSYEGHRLSTPLKEAFLGTGLMDRNQQDWPVTMVRMAIPFAMRSVTVIAPDSFVVPRSLFEEGVRNDIEVRIVPHSYFPLAALRKMSIWFAVPAHVDSHHKEFDPIFTRAFGEPPDTNHRLLPKRWLDREALYSTRTP